MVIWPNSRPSKEKGSPNSPIIHEEPWNFRNEPITRKVESPLKINPPPKASKSDLYIWLFAILALLGIVAFVFRDWLEPLVFRNGIYCPSPNACSKLENPSYYKMCD